MVLRKREPLVFPGSSLTINKQTRTNKPTQDFTAIKYPSALNKMIFLLGAVGGGQYSFVFCGFFFSLSLTSLGNQHLTHAASFNSQTFYDLSSLSRVY